ncbi:DNA helicase [Burkholderia ubonensis]|uniref:AAA domain-containing protein n=1 Tax=Burkholderia ubonensis TaxID=101571 RepID=UPI00075C598C|nr:AAA domain-containing protein [Burkholderia ubonensis]KVU25144.1 DNA helicase [Burkholderia ubonensis]
MPVQKNAKRNKASLDDRFEFVEDAVAPSDRAALRAAVFEVEEKSSGAERNLKLWRKTGTPLDDDLRQLWLHEMRQVQRVMSYEGAREVIVDVLEFVEDDTDFGVVLERVGRPLTDMLRRASRQHWLNNVRSPRARILFWRNIRRLVTALGIVHAQGLVHGAVGPDAVMTEGADEPDFQLGGFEWSLWLSPDATDRSHAKVGSAAAVRRSESYSFAQDWQSLGQMIADCLDSMVKESGDVLPAGRYTPPIELNTSERLLLKRLVTPARMDQLDAESIECAIDDLLANVAQSASTRAGTFVLCFPPNPNVSEAIYKVSDGEIPIDEHRRQLDWIRADIDGGATLLVPRSFDPATDTIRLVTSTMVYRLGAFRDDGVAVWDIAVCRKAEVRASNFSLGDSGEHALVQPVMILPNVREAREARGRLGADTLDWSTFASPARDRSVPDEGDTVRNALLLVQTVEAVVKALEVYPVQVLEAQLHRGRRSVLLRAEPGNERDRIAKRIGLTESAVALKWLFEDDRRDAEAKWQLCRAPGLGSTRTSDVVASFVEAVEYRGIQAYRFEIDEDLPDEGPFFLRTERDTGTEQAIARRLRNIKTLNTRADLVEMLTDPWRVRRSSREEISEDARQDDAFLDLDPPKQKALVGLWSTLPSFFVVGPPGVGKTRLATEVVKRRFADDSSTRMLISAQGHDALDNLQDKIRDTLRKAGQDDVLVVRSTASERRPTSGEEVHRTGLDYLERLSQSALARTAPEPLRARVAELRDAASRMDRARDTITREQRSSLGAISHLILDAANIVISTVNSADIESLVEARQQFDWVIVEEAAKATGPELIGPLMLSGRRLLIGDHRQLPPFESERLVRILRDQSLVSEALQIAEQYVGSLLRDGELDELELIASDAASLKASADMALRLLEPFRTFVEDDERRGHGNPTHRPISETLTEQRRMDPAIAEVVSHAFYDGKLRTAARRAHAAETEDSPVVQLGALPSSPIVVVNFPHVSSTGRAAEMERGRPRWHNPSEVDSVTNVLKHLRARDIAKPPTLAILSPYKAQVDKIQERLSSRKSGDLQHLAHFKSVRSDGAFVGTVDSFQGSEADVVILSLVRNNPRNALGFLRDRRRMNVALSRAKAQLIIVGSLDFLAEAVRAVNPDGEDHDLSFLALMADAIHNLASQKRNDVALACSIGPDALKERI